MADTQYERLNDAAFLAMEQAHEARVGIECQVDATRVHSYVPRNRLPSVKRVAGGRFVACYWHSGERHESDRAEYQAAFMLLRVKLEDAEEEWRPHGRLQGDARWSDIV